MKRLFVLLAVLALVAAACGSSDDPTTTEAAGGGTTASTEAPVSEIQAASNACAEGATDGPLNLYNWTD